MPLGVIKNMLNLDVGNQKISIDGQPAFDIPDGFGFGNKVRAARRQMDLSRTEGNAFVIKAFIVSGDAPAELFDLNGDGSIDANDATLAGHKVLSNVVEVPVGILPIPYVGTCAEPRDLNAIYGRLVPCNTCAPQQDPGCALPGGSSGLGREPR